jgi:two-component system, OmpR family, sensor kinase
VTLRRRLVLAFAYLLVLVVVALAIPLGVSVDRRAKDAFYARLSAQGQVVATSLGGTPLPGGTLTNLRQTVRNYGSQIGGRVIVTDRSNQGLLLADSDDADAPPKTPYNTAGRPEIGAALRGESVRLVRHSADLGGDLLVVAYPVLNNGQVVGTVRLSQPMAAVDARVRRSWEAIAAVAVVVAIVGLVVAWALATSLAQPLRSLEGTAGRLGRGDLEARAEVTGPPDVAAVAVELNRMAAELTALLDAQREFVANASHQMRTPLTGLRLRLEALAAGPPPDPEAELALREVDRMSDLVADLLVLARAGVPPRTATSSDLAEQARAAADRWRPVAEDREQTFALEAPRIPVVVGADPSDVAIVLDNLIENAIVYSPAGTTISVTVSKNGGGTVRVEDDGPGIQPSEANRVFDRFFRGKAGSGVPGGTGLGLTIVHDLAARWSGSVDLEPSGRGTRIAVRFPEPGDVTELTEP